MLHPARFLIHLFIVFWGILTLPVLIIPAKLLRLNYIFVVCFILTSFNIIINHFLIISSVSCLFPPFFYVLSFPKSVYVPHALAFKRSYATKVVSHTIRFRSTSTLPTAPSRMYQCHNCHNIVCASGFELTALSPDACDIRTTVPTRSLLTPTL